MRWVSSFHILEEKNGISFHIFEEKNGNSYGRKAQYIREKVKTWHISNNLQKFWINSNN